MIETYKDSEGRVLSYVLWWITDRFWKADPNGEYIWIEELWVHNTITLQQVYPYFAKRVMGRVPLALYGCFWRQGKYGSKIKIYPKHYWLRRLKSEKHIKVA